MRECSTTLQAFETLGEFDLLRGMFCSNFSKTLNIAFSFGFESIILHVSLKVPFYHRQNSMLLPIFQVKKLGF